MEAGATTRIYDCPGFPVGIRGRDLASGRPAARDAGIELTPAAPGDDFVVTTDGGGRATGAAAGEGITAFLIMRQYLERSATIALHEQDA